MFKLQRGDLVCDLNKEPEPSINMGRSRKFWRIVWSG